MIIDPMRLGSRAYTAFVHKPSIYYEHAHMAYELTYCLKGSFHLNIDGKSYVMKKGDFSIVAPMHSHEIPNIPIEPDTLCLVIIASPSMLKNFFKILTSKTTTTPVFNINIPEHEYLLNLLHETYYLKKNITEVSEINVKGNIYKIFSYIYEHFLTENANNKLSSTISVSNVQNALDYIHENYSEKITIKDIASFCGYSEATFSNQFKKITGRTFHYTLNHYRVEVACTLLRETNLSIKEIASSTGFGETKNFFRTFKTYTGVTPNTYRKLEHLVL